MTEKVLKPNPGPQTEFLTTSADEAWYGGLPGGGKSVGLLLEFLGNHESPLFRALILRRIGEDLRTVGGIWDSSKTFYEGLDFKTNEVKLTHTSPSGAVLGFGSMRDAQKDHLRYKSIEAELIAFEELPEFERHQYRYMKSRNRGKSDIKPYIRATMNPQAGWVAKTLMSGGYVNSDGFAIPEMSGVIRWYYIDEVSDNEVWFDTEQECLDAIAEKDLKDVTATSFTFILASAKDNPYQSDDYVAKLSNLSKLDRARLKDGNWKIESSEDGLFKKSDWRIASRHPRLENFKKIARSWDLAATEKKPTNDPAYTAGLVGGITKDNIIWIFHGERFRKTPLQSLERFKALAAQDAEIYGRVVTTYPIDPGQAVKYQKHTLTSNLSGYPVDFLPMIGSKLHRAEDAQLMQERGEIILVLGDWNDDLINEGATFPHGKFKDYIDALSDLVDFLTGKKRKRKKDRTKKSGWTS